MDEVAREWWGRGQLAGACTMYPSSTGQRQSGLSTWTVLHSLKARIWGRTGRKNLARHRGGSGLGWMPPHPCTGRSSNMTLETTRACRREGGRGRVEELPVGQVGWWQGRGPVSTLVWDGEGSGVGHVRLSVCPACLLAGAQSFHSFLMVRFHSHDRWSVLSSSVKRDLML